MKKLLFILSFLIFQYSISQTGSELIVKAKEYQKLGKSTSEIFPLIEQAANLKNPEAQYLMGWRFENGIAETKIDIPKALIWYEKAYKQGWIPATRRIVEIYGRGLGVKKNEEKAFDIASKCAKDMHPQCIELMIIFYQKGVIVEQNIEKEMEWMEKLAMSNPNTAVKLKYEIADARLAMAYKSGFYNSSPEFIKSYAWFLLYNELKIGFGTKEQESVIRDIETIENELSDLDLKKSYLIANEINGSELVNASNLKIVQ